MSDIHDAHWQRRGYDFRGECVGSGGVDEGSCRSLSEDGEGLSQGADSDTCVVSLESGGVEVFILVLCIRGQVLDSVSHRNA